MSDLKKKATEDEGVSLDEDKLVMVSGGMGGGDDEYCYKNPNGEHFWIKDPLTGRECCEYCGVYK